MKKLLSLLFAALMVLTFSFATLAEDKPAAEKPAAADGKKKAKKKHAAKHKDEETAKGAKK